MQSEGHIVIISLSMARPWPIDGNGGRYSVCGGGTGVPGGGLRLRSPTDRIAIANLTRTCSCARCMAGAGWNGAGGRFIVRTQKDGERKCGDVSEERSSKT